MEDRLNVIKLAQDMITKRVSAEYSDSRKNSDALVEKLIELNGGSTKLDIKTFHRGNAVFDIVEAIIPTIIHEGLKGDEYFFSLVDYRNVALGDDIDFWTTDKSEFVVADASYGTSGIRRQRLGMMEKYNVPTAFKVIKVYDEVKRLLANRIDFNEFIQAVARAMVKEVNETIYKAWEGVSAATHGLNATYVKNGSYEEDTLLDLVAHVEAANNGSKAVIIGTKKALRKITTATVATEAKTDMYNMGYYGKFNGTDMVYIPQVHKAGTDEFLLDDTKVYVVAGEDKPIKCVNIGEGLIQVKEGLDTPDFTQNYLYGQEIGVGICFNAKMGFYTMA